MNINNMLKIQGKLVPETLELFVKRYEVLKIINVYQPIGRRSLSKKTGISERSMRTELDKLNEINLIRINSSGVELTDEGREVLEEAHKTFYFIRNLSELELQLKEKLNLKRVVIIPGDVEADTFTFNNLGRRAAEVILELIKNDITIGITGGTTMACLVNQMHKKKGFKNLLVVPARGALNEELEIQANTIAANLAVKLSADYKLLHIPDNLDDKELEVLKNNKIISEVLDDIKKIDLLVFGLGNAYEMAKRRNTDIEAYNKIKEEKLIAEAFGYYFNHKGEMKMQTNSVGMTLKNFVEIKNKVGVAAGKSKAEAISAIAKFNSNFILVTDENTAKIILDL